MATRSEELSTPAADAATGAAVEAAEAISDPAGSAAKQVRRLERAGAPVNRRIEGQFRRAAERTVDTTGKLLNGTVTERLVLRGLHLVKAQARRDDVVGLAAYRSLEILHGGFGSAARSLSRFQDASQPPVRPSERRRSQTRPRTRTETGTRRRTASTASGAAGEARSSARPARSPRRSGGQAGKTA